MKVGYCYFYQINHTCLQLHLHFVCCAVLFQLNLEPNKLRSGNHVSRMASIHDCLTVGYKQTVPWRPRAVTGEAATIKDIS